MGMINFVFSCHGCIIQSESGYFEETVHWDWFKDVESLVNAFVDFQTKKLTFFLLSTTSLVNVCVTNTFKSALCSLVEEILIRLI